MNATDTIPFVQDTLAVLMNGFLLCAARQFAFVGERRSQREEHQTLAGTVPRVLFIGLIVSLGFTVAGGMMSWALAKVGLNVGEGIWPFYTACLIAHTVGAIQGWREAHHST
jgi:hypothetical protein